MTRRESCGACHFWDQTEAIRAPEKGLCRLNPPSTDTVVIPQQHAISRETQLVIKLNQHCPTTHQDEWCGQFKPKHSIQLAS